MPRLLLLSGFSLRCACETAALHAELCKAMPCLQTLRTLVEMSPNDADKLRLYQEAKELLAGLPSIAYPDRELQWLVTTCWNRGAHQAKFQRCEIAEQYMRLALGLLDHCHSLSARKQVGSMVPQDPASTGLWASSSHL